MTTNQTEKKPGGFLGRYCHFVAAFIGLLGILGAAHEQAQANDIAYRETLLNTDFVSSGVGGMRNAQQANINLTGLSGTINKAYLYWAGPMNTTNLLANATILVNGTAVTGENIGLSDDNCWGYDVSQTYRADITPLVQAHGNGMYILTDFVHLGTNINANGASILAFFDDGDPSNNRDIVLFDGNDSNAANPYDALGWNVSLSGINYTSGRAFIELHVSDGQVYPDAAVIVNGTIVQQGGDIFQGESVPHANDGPMQRGSLWDIKTWEITSVLEPGTNDLLLTHSFIGQDCISLVAAVINLPMGAAPPPPPVNHPPELSGIPELTINSTNAIPLMADVRDDDGDPLTYRISIDGVEVKTGSIPAGQPITTGMLSVTNSLGLGQHTVVFSANDGKSSASLTTRVNVIDNTPPMLQLPPNMTVPADLGKNTAVVNYVVTATDDFPGVLVISLPASGTEFPIGVTTVTVTAVDTSGNATTGTFTITVTDSTPPSIHCPPDIIQATDVGSSTAVVHYTVPATDNMPGLSLTCTPPSGSVFPIGITTVVCLARDAAGNTASCMFRVTIVDREPPVINVSTNIVTVSDLNQCSAIVQYEVSVHDNTPGVSLICEPPSGSAFPVGTTIVGCIATDTAGNKAANSFTVTVQDTESPTIAPALDVTVPTDAGKGTAVVHFQVSATDNCSSATVLCTPASGSVFPLGTTTVTCIATDAAGNMTTTSFNVAVVDQEPPVVTVPNNLTVLTDPGQNTAVVNFVVSIQDNVPGATLVVTPPSGSSFPLGTTTVVAVGTDAAGNQTTNSFTITVVDAEKPVLQLPADIIVTVPAGVTNAVVSYTVTATDNGSTVTVVTTPTSGSTFPLGTTVVNAQATDSAGNVSTGAFTVTVVQENNPDKQPPVISVPPAIVQSADLGQCAAVVTFTVTAVDNEPGQVVVLCTPPSGSTFPLGTTIVVCVATDAAGNKATNSFTVTIEDRENPVLHLPAALNVATDAGKSTAVVNFNVNGSDNCSGVSIACSPASGSVFPLGATPVNCTATDGAGNSASGSFMVQVADLESPVVTVPGPIIVPTDPGQNTAVVNFVVGIQDNVPGATLVVTPPSGSSFPLGTTTVVAVGTDAAGNQTTNSFTVTVVDTENPVLHLPEDIVVVVPVDATNAVVQYTVSATDNSQTVTVVIDPPSGSTFPLGTNTVTVQATDNSGNVSTGTFTVIVLQENPGDLQPPVITTPGNLIQAADVNQCSAVVTFQVTVTDNNAGATVVCTPPSSSTFPRGTTTVVCVATDLGGNKATSSFTVTIEDRENPVLHLPAALNVATDAGKSTAVVNFNVNGTDNCSGVSIACSPASGSVFPLGATPVNCTATDGAGNSASGSFMVQVADLEPPVVTVPGPIIVPTDPGQNTAVVNFVVGIQDNVSGATLVVTPPSGSSFPLGTTTVVAVGTDAAGSQTTNSFTITVVDAEKPVLQLPADIVVTVPAGVTNAVVSYTVTATDNGSTVTVVTTPTSGSSFPLGTTVVNAQATDSAGNVSTGSFTVTVVQENNPDNQPPVITVPPAILQPADLGQCAAVVTFAVTAIDNEPGQVTVLCTPPSGSVFPLGTTPVTCLATDAAGNKATNSFTVTIEDRENPVLHLPAALNVATDAGKSTAVVNFNVNGTDNCSGVSIACSPASGSVFPLGATPVNCTATDGAGNSASGSFMVQVADLEPPVVTVPGPIIVPTDPGQNTAVVNFVVGIQDNVPGATLVVTPPSGSSFPLGTTTVVAVGTDAAGNQTTNSFTVTVVDTENPVLHLPEDIVVVVPVDVTNAVVQYTVSATDNSQTVTVVIDPPSGSTFPLGTNTVTVQATDNSGNVSTGTFTVIVLQENPGDLQPPVITTPGNLIQAADVNQCSAVVTFQVTVTDNNPGATVVCTPPSGSTFPRGTTTVVCVATDLGGNKATNTFTVTVVDREKPALQLPGDVAVAVTASQTGAIVTYVVTATDNCSTPTLVCEPPSGSVFPKGATPVQCSAVDADGNTATGSFKVIVNQPRIEPDTQPPTINGATNWIVATALGQCSAVVNYTVTVQDNVPGATVLCTPSSGSTFPKGVTPVVCVASDFAGNQATNTFTVTVVDRENPALQLPGDITVAVTAPQTSTIVTYVVTASDNCSTPTPVCQPPSGSVFPLGVTLVQCTATDADGNVATGGFQVNVTQLPSGGGGDNQPPVIDGATNRIVATALGQCSAVVNYTVTVQDNVPGATVLCTPPSGSTFVKGVTPVVCVASDLAGNHATNAFTVTVVDHENPALQLPGDITVAVTAPQTSTIVTYVVTASDNCSTPTPVCQPPSGSVFPLGVTLVQCTATDADGNVATGAFQVNVTQLPSGGGGDNQPPVIDGATNRIVATDLSQCSAVVNYTVTVQDNLPGATVLCTPPSGFTFPKGVTPVVCVASDLAGNHATNAFTVTVVDRENPALQLPGDISVAVTAPQTSTIVTYVVTASDNCSTPTPVCQPPSGSVFPLGVTLVQCTATDADGNVATGGFQVNVTQLPNGGGGDNQPPVIDGATNRIVAADLSQCSAVVNYTVTVQDNLPGATVLCTPPSGSTFPKGVSPVVCMASDLAGNQATNTFTVTVVDLQNPSLQLPADQTITIGASETSAIVTFAASATDNCSVPSVVCSPASGSAFPVGVTTVSCTATDEDGNAATGTFKVTVNRLDTQPPTVIDVRPSQSVLWPPNHKMVPIHLIVTATDDSGLPVTSRIVSVTSSEPLDGLADGHTAFDWQITGNRTLNLRAERSGKGPGRTYTITVETIDAAGNVTTSTALVLVPHSAPRKSVHTPKRSKN